MRTIQFLDDHSEARSRQCWRGYEPRGGLVPLTSPIDSAWAPSVSQRIATRTF